MESSVSSELHDLVRSLRSRKSPRMGCTHSRVFSLHDDVRARSARTPTLFSPLAILEILAILGASRSDALPSEMKGVHPE